jgi:hypothetical protein
MQCRSLQTAIVTRLSVLETGKGTNAKAICNAVKLELLNCVAFPHITCELVHSVPTPAALRVVRQRTGSMQVRARFVVAGVVSSVSSVLTVSSGEGHVVCLPD